MIKFGFRMWMDRHFNAKHRLDTSIVSQILPVILLVVLPYVSSRKVG